MANWLKDIKGVLLDISGTLHVDYNPTRDAVQALKRLQQSGITVKLVTNGTQKSKSGVYNRLTELGFDINYNEIFTSLTATRKLIEAKGLRPFCLLQDDAMEDFAGLDMTNPNAVVVGLAPDYFTYKHLNQAFRLLMNNKDCMLIAVYKGRYRQSAEGLSLGPGPFVEALEYASDKKAVVVGKPQSEFFQSVLQDIGCSAEETLMIGDDVTTDILGALHANIGGVLVKTGKYRDGDETLLQNQERCMCVNDFATAVDIIIAATLCTAKQTAHQETI